MLQFHIIIIMFSIFTNKISQSDTFFPKLKNTIVKIDIKSFSVYYYNYKKFLLLSAFEVTIKAQNRTTKIFRILTVFIKVISVSNWLVKDFSVLIRILYELICNLSNVCYKNT